MTSKAKLAYAQTRMQARYGARPSAEDWRRLDTVRSPARLIELARATALAPWAELVSAEMDHHALERRLRAGWRASVAETAGWLPESWRGAVALLAETPELPLRDHVVRGLPAPDWLGGDERLAETAEDAAPPEADAGAGPDWLARWRAAWLDGVSGAEAAALERLGERFFGHFARADIAARPSRAELETASLRVFRRFAGARPAVFAYLCLAALDFERFRGRLLERMLFAAELFAAEERSVA